MASGARGKALTPQEVVAQGSMRVWNGELGACFGTRCNRPYSSIFIGAKGSQQGEEGEQKKEDSSRERRTSQQGRSFVLWWWWRRSTPSTTSEGERKERKRKRRRRIALQLEQCTEAASNLQVHAGRRRMPFFVNNPRVKFRGGTPKNS